MSHDYQWKRNYSTVHSILHTFHSRSGSMKWLPMARSVLPNDEEVNGMARRVQRRLQSMWERRKKSAPEVALLAAGNEWRKTFSFLFCTDTPFHNTSGRCHKISSPLWTLFHSNFAHWEDNTLHITDYCTTPINWLPTCGFWFWDHSSWAIFRLKELLVKNVK